MGTHRSKDRDTETDDLVAEYLAKGGKITKIETKSMPNELGISNVTWSQPLSKKEKQAKEGPLDDKS